MIPEVCNCFHIKQEVSLEFPKFPANDIDTLKCWRVYIYQCVAVQVGDPSE